MKSKFWLSIIGIFLIAFFGFAGNRVNTVEKIGGDVYGEVISENGMDKSEYSYIYGDFGQLEPDAEDIYLKMCEMIQRGESEFEFRNANRETVINTYLSVLRDHPEYFWLGRGYSYKTTEYLYGTSVSLKPSLSSHYDELYGSVSQLESAVNEVLSLCEGAGSAYEKMITVHDYIVDNTDYDYETYNYISTLKESSEVFDSATAYGCLVNHKAICSGYAAAFQLIMQRLGIPCGRVTGAKVGGENHEWNYVFLDNDYYYVDVTWDDPQSLEDFKDIRSYEFFCITTEELERTHVIDEGQFVPLCTAVKYDYYIYYNRYFNTYDFYGFREYVRNHPLSNITVKFSTEDELNKAVYDLFTNRNIFRILSQNYISYSIGSSGLVLCVPVE